MTRLDEKIRAEEISWSVFHQDALTLSESLSTHPRFKGIIAVTRGGLFPAGILARELKIKTIETVSLETYHDETNTQQQETTLFKKPDFAGNGADWLLVDDLVDTGATAQILRDLVPEAYFVTLYAKPKGQDQVDQFVRTFDQDVWLFFPWDMRLQYAPPIIL